MRYSLLFPVLALLFAASPARAQYDIQGTIHGSGFGFPTYTETLGILDQMRAQYPHLITARSAIGQTSEGRSLWMVELSDNPGVDEGEPETFYMGLLHGSEPLGLATSLYTMWYLLEQYGTNPEVTYLLDNRRLFVVPIVNPDGYEYNLAYSTPGGAWEKNRSLINGFRFGVNLDHNFGFRWNFGGSSCGNESLDCFRGFAPFSELETQALRTFVNSRRLRTSLSYHSFHNSAYRAEAGRFVYAPWGHESLAPPEAALLDRMSETLAEENGYRDGALGGSENFVDGAAMDWLFAATDEHARIYPFDLVIGFEEDWPSTTRITALARENVRAGLDLLWYAGAFVAPLDFTVTDVGAGANGHLDPGEAGQVTVRVQNDGGAPAQGVQFRLHSTASDLAVSTAWSAPVTLAPGATTTVGPFPLSASASRPLGVSDDLRLEIGYAPTVARTRLLPDLAVGTPEVLYAWDGTSLEDWCLGVLFCPPPPVPNNNTWALTSDAHSPPSAFTDSPNGFMTRGGTSEITTQVSLVGPGPYYVSFWAKWQIKARNSLAIARAVDLPVTQRLNFPTRRTHPAEDFPVQSTYLGQPVFDGAQFEWVREVADLTPFADIPFTLRFLGYANHSPYALPSEGIYVDDIEIFRLVNGAGAGGGSGLTIACTPTNPPITLASSGGRYSYTVSITNSGSSLQTFDAWAGVTGPASRTVGPRRLTLAPGASLTRTLRQAVPANAPPGTYTHTCYVGSFPATSTSSSSFAWTKAPTGSRQAGEPVAAWGTDADFVEGLAASVQSVPEAYALEGAAPNPFTSTTAIRYALPEAASVRLSVYDLLGREVAVLVDERIEAGRHQAIFDASGLAAGVYVYRIQAGAFAAARRVTVLR